MTTENKKLAAAELVARHLSVAHLLGTVAMMFAADVEEYLNRNNLMHREIKQSVNGLERAFNLWCRAISKTIPSKENYADMTNDCLFFESLVAEWAGCNGVRKDHTELYKKAMKENALGEGSPMAEDERHYYDFTKGVRYAEAALQSRVSQIKSVLEHEGGDIKMLIDEAMKSVKSKKSRDLLEEAAKKAELLNKIIK